MLEARIALAEIVRRVRLSLVPGQALVVVPSITLRPQGPLWMSAVAQERLPSGTGPKPTAKAAVVAGGGDAPAPGCPMHAGAAAK